MAFSFFLKLLVLSKDGVRKNSIFVGSNFSMKEYNK